MNRERRKKIKNISLLLEEIQNKTESIKDDEEYAFDNMPEGIQSSMRGDESQEAIELLDVALEKIEEAIALLQEVS